MTSIMFAGEKMDKLPVRYETSNSYGITYHNEYHDSFVVQPPFEPKYSWECEENIDETNTRQIGTQKTDVVVLKSDNGRDTDFYFNGTYPTLPLKACGEIWHEGWDIPTRYAVDASNQCYMDGAHGGYVCPVLATELLSQFERPQDRVSLEVLLGLEPSYVNCPCCHSLVERSQINRGKFT